MEHLRVFNMAALTALPKAGWGNGQQVTVSYYSTANDGGGGTFYWNLGSSTTADGGTVFAADEGGTGRWKRIIGDVPINFQWFGVLADGSDQTTPIVNALGAISATSRALYLMPPGINFDIAAVQAALPVGVRVLNLSHLGVFDVSSQWMAGIQLLSNDEAADDARFEHASSHHPVYQLNNSGTAGTDSANKLRMSFAYSHGWLNNGGVGESPTRETHLLQLGNLRSDAKWTYWFTQVAPWAARDYESWQTGKAKVIGNYVLNSESRMYVAASNGTTGATEPVHTTGTVSDGGVNWTHSWDAKSLFEVNEDGDFFIRTRLGVGMVATSDVGLSVNGAINIKDGVSSPVTLAGMTSIYVDTADGDLKVRFGDGVVKVLATDT